MRERTWRKILSSKFIRKADRELRSNLADGDFIERHPRRDPKNRAAVLPAQ